MQKLHDCRFQFRRRPRPPKRKLNAWWLGTIRTEFPSLEAAKDGRKLLPGGKR